MFGNSLEIISNQSDIHELLFKTLEKNIANPFKKPISDFSYQKFKIFLSFIKSNSQYSSLILDSGCGTAYSSFKLAEIHENSLIIAIDKSEFRISKTPQSHPRVLILRADLIDFYILCHQNDILFEKNYFLYPNPWPKKNHLARRWHAHPIFPYIIKISKEIEIRTNWEIYIKEFVLSFEIFLKKEYNISMGESYSFLENQKNDFLSLFEKKYTLSGHKIYYSILRGIYEERK